MSMMISLIDTRINSTSGHCFDIKANEAIWVPPACVREAIALGMTEAEEQEAPKVMEAPAKTDDNVMIECAVELDRAILRILARNDASDFKNDGNPKAARVIAEMDPKCPRPAASDISRAFERLQNSVNSAE